MKIAAWMSVFTVFVGLIGFSFVLQKQDADARAKQKMSIESKIHEAYTP